MLRLECGEIRSRKEVEGFDVIGANRVHKASRIC